jgi:hypothetical protein
MNQASRSGAAGNANMNTFMIPPLPGLVLEETCHSIEESATSTLHLDHFPPGP